MTGNCDPDADKNADVFTKLMHCVDGRSFTLISKKTFKILREHYFGKNMPRIISLKIELTSFKIK